MIGHHSQWDFEGLVCNNLITHCPIMSHNMPNTYNNFGPDQGENSKKKNRMDHHKTYQHTEINHKTKGDHASGRCDVCQLCPILTCGLGIGLLAVKFAPCRRAK